MSVLPLLLDENVSAHLYDALRRHRPDIEVRRVGDPDAPALQTADPEILLWCEANGFALVTNNRASMPVHLRDHLLAGRHVAGIFILAQRVSISETLGQLALVWRAADAREYRDRLVYLPLRSQDTT